MKRKVLLVLALCCIILMLYGWLVDPAILLFPIIEDPYLPYGTIAAWFALISLSSLPFLTSSNIRTPDTVLYLALRYITIFGFMLALAWSLVGRFMAGNWNYNFGPREEFVGSVEASYWFSRYTGLILLLFLITIFLLIGYSAYLRIAGSKPGK